MLHEPDLHGCSSDRLTRFAHLYHALQSGDLAELLCRTLRSARTRDVRIAIELPVIFAVLSVSVSEVDLLRRQELWLLKLKFSIPFGRWRRHYQDARMNTLPDAPTRLDSPSDSAPQIAKVGKWRRIGARSAQTISKLMVFIAVVGLLLWGHRTGWTVPKFSSLAGQADSDEKIGWCGDHNVPESECVECNSDLMPKPRCLGWCKLHGVHDCPFCHPEVAQVNGNPQIVAAALARVKRPEVDQSPENNSECMLHERRIQFASPEAVEKAGIEVATVETAPAFESISGNGEVGYNQNRLARLSARVPGSVYRVLKQEGDLVKAGEVIAVVDAAEVGRTKYEFLQALIELRAKSRGREAILPLQRAGDIPQIKVQEIESALSGAKTRLTAAQQALINLGLAVDLESVGTLSENQVADRLRFLGLPQALTDTFDRTATGNLLPVATPLDGVVVARDVVAGEVVDSAKPLFVVADTRTMWLTLDVRLEDARHVAPGQEVQFSPDGGHETNGRVTWISAEADRKTRTVQIRAVLENGDGRLFANAFGTGKVILSTRAQTVTVPNAAVQWEGCCHVVFVRDKDFFQDGVPKVFHVRTVRLGAEDDKRTEIVAGLLPGESVVTSGSSLLRAELLKGNLGEGCACCKK